MAIKLSVFINGLFLSIIACGILLFSRQGKSDNISVFSPSPTPLSVYRIENLKTVNFSNNGSDFVYGKELHREDGFISNLFSFKHSPSLNDDNKTVSGVINTPLDGDTFPIIVMVRGYVDKSIYTSGMGTKNSSYAFSRAGFITLAPDFLGYGDSDKEADNIFEARFQTYTTLLTLINNLDNIEKWDKQNVFIWAHSNGGQITLTALEVGEYDYPTVLWAPVSKPFPYSVLYYTDESADGGKYIRAELSKFEEVYESDKFSFSNYLDHLNKNLLIEIHQGSDDDAVPPSWSTSLYKDLVSLNINTKLYTYPMDNHNLSVNWDLAISRSINFFKDNLK